MYLIGIKLVLYTPGIISFYPTLSCFTPALRLGSSYLNMRTHHKISHCLSRPPVPSVSTILINTRVSFLYSMRGVIVYSSSLMERAGNLCDSVFNYTNMWPRTYSSVLTPDSEYWPRAQVESSGWPFSFTSRERTAPNLLEIQPPGG